MKRSLLCTPTFEKTFKMLHRENATHVFRLMTLLTDLSQTPFEGLGKPEGLKHDYAGCWSRRITQEHRLIYRVTEQNIELLSCFGHYLD